jgi:hypothetical protein
MTDQRPSPVRLELPRWAAVLIAAVVLLLFGTFFFMTKVLLDQRHLIDSQNRKAFAQLERLTPVLRGARPVLDEARGQAAPTRAALRDGRRFARSAQPLIDSLTRADLDSVAQVTGEAAAAFLHDLPRAREALDLTAGLLQELGRRRATDRLLRAADETVRLRVRTDRLLAQQQRALDIQAQSLAAQKETLAIQKEALQHIRSLDAKTGGPILAAGARRAP